MTHRSRLDEAKQKRISKNAADAVAARLTAGSEDGDDVVGGAVSVHPSVAAEKERGPPIDSDRRPDRRQGEQLAPEGEDDPLPPTAAPMSISPVEGAPTPQPEWSEEDERLIAWTKVVAGPQQPFNLGATGVRVVDPVLWWSMLMAEIAVGPVHPRCRLGATLGDVKAYRDQLVTAASRAVVEP